MAYTPHYTSIIEQRRSALRTELSAILPPDSEFVLEIGCGHGHFLAAYAAAHPGRTCVGIDLIGERIERARRKRDRAKLAHLHFIQAEARLFLEALPAGAQISTVFVLFPDPWPKLRHNKHRIIQPAFLSALAGHTVPGCPLYFRTDFGPYFDAARAVLSDDSPWQVESEPWPFEFATVFQQRAPSYQSLVARKKSCGNTAGFQTAAPAPR